MYVRGSTYCKVEETTVIHRKINNDEKKTQTKKVKKTIKTNEIFSL